jgi:amino acid adenylation domain-containing protein
MMNSAVCLLDRAAQLYPANTAVDDGERCLDYAEYRRVSRAVATSLLKAGGASPVVVYLPKGIAALTCFMAAMYTGAPYVPVDSRIPISRLEKILDSLAPCVVVTDSEHAENLSCYDRKAVRVHLYDELILGEPDDALIDAAVSCVIDTDPIYIMFTSGSTGTPKGVTIPHRGIVDYADWVVRTFGFDESTVMANQSQFYFDNSTFDIYGCLRCGAKMLLTPENLFLYPLKLPGFLRDNKVTSIFWVPTVMINVANSGALEGCSLPSLKTVAFCGEVMPNKQLNIWRKNLPQCVYANLYGPTEITDVCCYYIVDREFADSDPLPIGKACENMRVLILTEDGKEAAANEQGELCVVGSGVALGYWNAPEITAKAFTKNPLSAAYPEIMYRTGDLAYVASDGLIMFLGRRDNQIKLRGNRIELGEIDSAAVCVPGVENACALFDDDAQEIVLFVETREQFPLRRFNMELKKTIPQYMLPSRLKCLSALPHTPNDKIDRVTLREKYIKEKA